MTRPPVVILANTDATTEALQLLGRAGIDVTLADPPPTLALTSPPHHAANGRRHRLAGMALSDRELQVLQLMSEGNTDPEIGTRLGLGRTTIRSHADRLFQKLGARDRAHAVLLGLRAGLIGAAS